MGPSSAASERRDVDAQRLKQQRLALQKRPSSAPGGRGGQARPPTRPTTAEQKLLAVEAFLEGMRQPLERKLPVGGTAFERRSAEARSAKKNDGYLAPMKCCFENTKYRDSSDSHDLGHKKFVRDHQIAGYA